MALLLSPEQERARAAILSWYRSPHRKPWFLLQGPAGSGKSSVLTATTESIGGTVLYAGPTGMSAKVMISKGCKSAQTLHSLIYKPKGTGGNQDRAEQIKAELHKLNPEDPANKPLILRLQKELAEHIQGATPIFSINPDSKLKDAKLLVVDEVSMCGKDIIEDILSFNVPVLFQGDRFQLPPVMSKSYFKPGDADFELTEVHRQAKDSPIIRLATMARNGQQLPLGDYGNGCQVIQDIAPEVALEHEQIILGTHVARFATNRKVREMRGYNGVYPNTGERLICRYNNNKIGLLNGDQYWCTSFKKWPDIEIKHPDGRISTRSQDKCTLGIENDQGRMTVTAHTEYFHEKEPDPWSIRSAECFDWAYSITCHSAQGSQWDSVYVLDQSRKFGKDASKWLYTACTRAAKRLTVKRKV